MKVKVTTVEEIEVDITYPSYKRSRSNIFKIISEKDVINVYSDDTVYRMSTQFMYKNYKDIEDITELEFIEAFTKAITNLNNLVK